MQQVSLTREHLVRFSEEYSRLPDVDIGNPYHVPATHVVPVAWLVAMSKDPTGEGSITLSAAFSGWLLGRGEFILMAEEQPNFENLIFTLFKEVVDVPDA